MTSCGLNRGDLLGRGTYPALICCNLTNGRMPHVANQRRRHIPMVTHAGETYFVANATKGTEIVYQYFSVSANTLLELTARGRGTIQVSLGDTLVGSCGVRGEDWSVQRLKLTEQRSHCPLRLKVLAGRVDLLSLGFHPEQQP